MKIVHCTKCGSGTPEGFGLCPTCMKQAGAGETEVANTAELLEIAKIINIGDPDARYRTSIENILKIAKQEGWI